MFIGMNIDNFSVVTLYRSRKQRVSIFEANIEEKTTLVNKEKTTDHILIGDSNINLKNKLNFCNDNFIQFMEIFKLRLTPPIDNATTDYRCQSYVCVTFAIRKPGVYV